MIKKVKPVYVLDACALLRLAQAEPGMEQVRDFLYSAQENECELLMHQINLGEVIYCIGKVYGWAIAERKRDEISFLPIKIIAVDDLMFWQAVRIKAEHALSYADAFAAALALAKNATLLTADPEFGSLGDRLKRITV